jgi:hypothetical protein
VKNLFLRLFLSFIGWAIIGNAAGMTPEQSAYTGAVGTGLSMLATAPSGSLRAGIDLSDVTSTLGAYWRKFEKDIWKAITQEIVFEQYTTKISGVTDEYVSTLSSHTEFLQPYQKQWTPKGAVTFTPYINKVRNIKADITVDGLDDLYATYLAWMADESKTYKDYPFVKWMIMDHIVPGIRQEIEMMSCQGEYAAPTPGTPGGYMTSVDGILTIVANEITATNLTPITTGAITLANAVDKFEQFNDDLPEVYQNMAGDILCSPTLAKYYARDYRNTFGSTNDQLAKNNLKIDASNKRIVGIPGFEGSGRILFTPKANLITMYDKNTGLDKFDVQQFQREIYILGNFKRGYGFRTLDGVFANDQA